MPVRRSARLRSRQASSEEPEPPTDPGNINTSNGHHNNPSHENKSSHDNALPTVMERDENPVIDAPPAPTHSPSAGKPTVKTPVKSSSAKKSPAIKTPTSAVTRPSHQEMHPSKVHQSTTKQADSGLILGFNPIPKDAEGNVVKDSLIQNTPTKTKPSPASNYGTPGFEFKFACQESQLSDEAKKLMESVREDVAKIKAQMAQQKDERSPQKDELQQAMDRRIAKPKGKAGRFSDVHMAEFKKMDSIAGHASAFRAAPGRFQPVQKTLKRTNSKARLDESDAQTPPAKSPVRPSAPTPNTATFKRAKQGQTDDISTRRPTNSQDRTPKPVHTRPRPAVRGSLMTPTRASAARTSSVSVKPPRTTMIPSLARSPASKPSIIPRTPQTEFNPRLKSNIPTLGNLKSILRRHQPLFSRDPAKIAAGTHHTAPDFSPSALLHPPRGASEEPAQTLSPKKHVEFASGAEVDTAMEDAPASPSPSKIPTAARPVSDVVYPALPALTPESKTSTIRSVRPSEVPTNSASLPEVPGVPHGIGHKKRHREAAEGGTDVENVPPTDPISEARSAKRVKLNSPAPSKTAPSPLKSRTPSRTISGTGRARTPASVRQSRGALSMSRLNMLAQPKNRS
ncbi:hypothetical protein BDV59DRAFT_171087 [Aspergillus ambiguus]|uniref:uncharacterized protein n=1 Tax=Aspergillus ambiguus TaxID=176160 RepID=UPI003CCDBF13